MFCSIEMTCQQVAVVAATLANDGVCPTTGRRIFRRETVRNCLSLMASCGMYDYSGEFAFTMGFPAKSGVAGALMIVIPNVAVRQQGRGAGSGERRWACGRGVRGKAIVMRAGSGKRWWARGQGVWGKAVGTGRGFGI